MLKIQCGNKVRPLFLNSLLYVISGFHRARSSVGSSQAYSNRCESFKEHGYLLVQPALKFINSPFCPRTVAFRYDSQKEQRSRPHMIVLCSGGIQFLNKRIESLFHEFMFTTLYLPTGNSVTETIERRWKFANVFKWIETSSLQLNSLFLLNGLSVA